MLMQAQRDISQLMAEIKILKAEIAEMKQAHCEAVDSETVD